MELLIRRSGNLIDISPDGRSPLPREIQELLRPHLTYEHRTLLRGHDRYGPTGEQRAVDVEVRQLYAVEEGRVTTAFGLWSRLVPVLQQAGHTLQCVDLSPTRQRPHAWTPDWENCQRRMHFRAGQQESLAAITQSWGGVIDAPTGFGKTFLFEAMCHLFPHAKIDIVVRPKDVAERIVRQLTNSLPNVGIVGAGRNQPGPRITVYTAGSLHRSDGEADFLLADEAHNLITERTSQELAKYRFSRNFGFTATPKGRLDNADVRLEMFFGQVIFRMSYSMGVAAGLVCPIRVRWLPICMERNPAAGKADVPKMRWGIWRNEVRNQAIAQDIYQTYAADTQILVLCATIEHAVYLGRHLPDFSLCYSSMDDVDFEMYKRQGLLSPDAPRMTPEHREQLRRGFEAGTVRRVIATDVWATGVDFASLQVLYRVDARESTILDTQAPGRVSRLADGKTCGEVVDCLDAFDPSFRRKAERRRSHYNKLGWEQAWPRC